MITSYFLLRWVSLIFDFVAESIGNMNNQSFALDYPLQLSFNQNTNANKPSTV